MNISRKMILGATAVSITAVGVAAQHSSSGPHSGRVPSGVVAQPPPTLAQLCTPGYTATIRPPASYTTGLKQKQITDQHLSGTTKDYEEDHVVPLEVGGAPRDENNLFPEVWSEAHRKDKIENAYHDAMCAGRITVAQAQQVFLSHSWFKAKANP